MAFGKGWPSDGWWRDAWRYDDWGKAKGRGRRKGDGRDGQNGRDGRDKADEDKVPKVSEEISRPAGPPSTADAPNPAPVPPVPAPVGSVGKGIGAREAKEVKEPKEESAPRAKDEVFEEIRNVLNANPALQIQFFDARVRQHLHALLGNGGRQRLKAALTMVHTCTLHKTRQDVKNWPAYLLTLLKKFDSDMSHQDLSERRVLATKIMEAKNNTYSSASTTPEKTDREGNRTESSEGEADESEDEPVEAPERLEFKAPRVTAPPPKPRPELDFFGDWNRETSEIRDFQAPRPPMRVHDDMQGHLHSHLRDPDAQVPHVRLRDADLQVHPDRNAYRWSRPPGMPPPGPPPGPPGPPGAGPPGMEGFGFGSFSSFGAGTFGTRPDMPRQPGVGATSKIQASQRSEVIAR